MKRLKPLVSKKRTAKDEIASRLDALEELIESLKYEVRNLKARLSRADIRVNYVDNAVGAVQKGMKRATANRSYEKFIRSM